MSPDYHHRPQVSNLLFNHIHFFFLLNKEIVNKTQISVYKGKYTLPGRGRLLSPQALSAEASLGTAFQVQPASCPGQLKMMMCDLQFRY